MSPLFKRRRELAALEERERQGETFWSEHFSRETRVRLQFVMNSEFGGDYRAAEAGYRLLLVDLGQLALYKGSDTPAQQFYKYLFDCDDDAVPSVVEAFVAGHKRVFEQAAYRQAFLGGTMVPGSSRIPFNARLVDAINGVLVEDRIAFELIDGEMVPFASRELHVEVVEPVLRLLATPGWERVEKSYQSALSEIARGDGADAITDAGTALQEALVYLGAEGNQLGDLTTSAKNKGIIASHDAPLLQTIDKACRWASADRSNTGDAHNADEASREDAWFTIHVVGAILLRLSNGGSRVSG